MFATVIAYTLTGICLAVSVVVVVRSIGRMGTRRLTGLNDRDTAKRYFLLLLDLARHRMTVYDDGNDVQDSIYRDAEVLEAVEKKLRKHPEFSIRCLFNCPVPTPWCEGFAQDPRMEARTTGLGERAPRDTHLKVIDGGRMAYLARHAFGAMDRPYELVDCLNVAPWALTRVAREELGDCLERFDQRFQQASPR